MTTRFACIHGHFYQPPREDPWSGEVGREESAGPYHDWNQRIEAECYAPNAAARLPGAPHAPRARVQNYARMSFNFGPTLLSWLEENARETYEAILDADRASRERFSGHGSALAQAYNHVILPLATPRDKETQVRWGVRDFVHRFGRQPEGMWLPETAVDLDTLEVLAAEGMRFTILAPHQARRCRPPGGAWREVPRESIDPSRPYVQRLPSGCSIVLFFYDAPISRAVAFEGILASADRFAERLMAGFSDRREGPQLVHVATDGETYGHHHRHGEVALAGALETLDAGGEVRLTNYGELLALQPAEHEVEIVERTSWSCAHGVERWRADCGCHVGRGEGWNQAWRGPLREALEWLRGELEQASEREARGLFEDLWRARDEYVGVLLEPSESAARAFLERHAGRPLDPSEADRMLKLLELQRSSMLMFTSCGWFFDDVTGLETVQVLRYAGRAVELATELFGATGRSLDSGLRKRLAEARSNLPESGSAAQIYAAQLPARSRG